MINLLSPNDKHQLVAARQNVLLLRYNFVLLALLITIGLIYGAGFFLTMRGKTEAQAQLEADEARTISYADTRSEIQQFSKNLITAKSILSSEVTYSALIADVAKTLPVGTVLTNLTLGPDSFGKPITLAAATKTYNKALTLKTALEDSKLFQDVHLENIARVGTDETTANTPYPVAVTLKATFATLQEVQAIKKAETKP